MIEPVGVPDTFVQWSIWQVREKSILGRVDWPWSLGTNNNNNNNKKYIKCSKQQQQRSIIALKLMVVIVVIIGKDDRIIVKWVVARYIIWTISDQFVLDWFDLIWLL